jgi:hypothetical protein
MLYSIIQNFDSAVHLTLFADTRIAKSLGGRKESAQSEIEKKSTCKSPEIVHVACTLYSRIKFDLRVDGIRKSGKVRGRGNQKVDDCSPIGIGCVVSVSAMTTIKTWNINVLLLDYLKVRSEND